MNFERERISDIQSEVEPLLMEHWREIAHYSDIPLDVDWDFYRKAQTVRVFTVRDGTRLVGYACFFLAPNRHYKSSLQAVQDVLFILPEYRKGLLGLRFIRWVDEQLKAEGAQVVYQHVKRAHDFGRVLARQGYEEIETIHAKRLDKG